MTQATDRLEPAITVCLPTYNGAAFLSEAIESVLTQTHDDLELIIVDDGSTDDSVSIAEGFDDPRIRLFRNKEQLGIPGNWNRALTEARARYICIFHQDDVMLPQNLERKIAMLDGDPAIGFVHSAVDAIVDESAPTAFAGWVETADHDEVVEGDDYFKRLILWGNRIVAPTVVVRRSHIDELGGFDEALGFACDYALWLNISLSARVGFVSDPLVRYRWHGSNASHAFTDNRGVSEVEEAGRKALAAYRNRDEFLDSDVLEEAFSSLIAGRYWASELQEAKNWLDEERLRLMDALEAQIPRIEELETARAWLVEQSENWKHSTEHAEAVVAELEDHIGELNDERQFLIDENASLLASNARMKDRWARLEASPFGRFGVMLRQLESDEFDQEA